MTQCPFRDVQPSRGFVRVWTRVWHHHKLNHRLTRWNNAAAFYETRCFLLVPPSLASLPLREGPLTCLACIAYDAEV